MKLLDRLRVNGGHIPGEEKIVTPPKPLSEYRYRTQKHIPETVGLRSGPFTVLAFVGQNKRTESLFLIRSDAGFMWITTAWQFKKLVERRSQKRKRKPYNLTPKQERILQRVIDDIKKK